ncbi:mitochondrial splicing system protein [Tulasnella sp. 418]|nr:mitochondrial splicing system protein [Tulasnella sp. 418]
MLQQRAGFIRKPRYWPCRNSIKTPYRNPNHFTRSLVSTLLSGYLSGRSPNRQGPCVENLRNRRSSSLSPIRVLNLSQSQRNTIYALATPPGKAGIGIIRISGADVDEVFRSIVKPSGKRETSTIQGLPKPRIAMRCQFVSPVNGEILDDGLVLYFRANASYTGEDTLEFHIHSSRATISAVLKALSTIPGCRLAEPGEFTRRAFEAGRMDLTQVEGLRDLLDAETEQQRKLALRSAVGTTRRRFESIREQIIRNLAFVEAIIDFGEGEEIEDGVWEQSKERIYKLRTEIQNHLNDNRRGEILRNGIRLAIFGPPNAGKSSLLNYLAQREAAIVTPLPGTTRDVLELSLDIDGMPVVVADTAGLRKTDDVVERIGVDRAKEAVKTADIRLCVLSLPELLSSTKSRTPFAPSPSPIPQSISDLIAPETLFLINKSDLLPSTTDTNSFLETILPAQRAWLTSVQQGSGMSEFLSGFSQVLRDKYDAGETGNEPLITTARHRAHLENAVKFLDTFMEMDANEVVFAAEELRYAAQEVGRISGLIDVEEVLDSIFKEFCIGK